MHLLVLPQPSTAEVIDALSSWVSLNGHVVRVKEFHLLTTTLTPEAKAASKEIPISRDRKVIRCGFLAIGLFSL